MNVIVLWSGGKDSCLAYYKAKEAGYNIVSLLNFSSVEEKISLSHGLPSEIIKRQTELVGVPLVQKPVSKGKYREEFKRIITEYKREKNVGGVVFGDIYLQEHKDWIDKICEEIGVEAVMPLWGRDTSVLINEFVSAGFKAVIVALEREIMDERWLGCRIDNDFIEQLKSCPNVDLCGEKGEFHSFVYDGPVFKSPLKFITGKKKVSDKRCSLDLVVV